MVVIFNRLSYLVVELSKCHRSIVKRTDMSSGVVSRHMRSDLCVVNSSTCPPFSVKPINVTKMYIRVYTACSTTLCHLRT